jgi:hypothetical protein
MDILRSRMDLGRVFVEEEIGKQGFGKTGFGKIVGGKTMFLE